VLGLNKSVTEGNSSLLLGRKFKNGIGPFMLVLVLKLKVNDGQSLRQKVGVNDSKKITDRRKSRLFHWTDGQLYFIGNHQKQKNNCGVRA